MTRRGPSGSNLSLSLMQNQDGSMTHKVPIYVDGASESLELSAIRSALVASPQELTRDKTLVQVQDFINGNFQLVNSNEKANANDNLKSDPQMNGGTHSNLDFSMTMGVANAHEPLIDQSMVHVDEQAYRTIEEPDSTSILSPRDNGGILSIIDSIIDQTSDKKYRRNMSSTLRGRLSSVNHSAQGRSTVRESISVISNEQITVALNAEHITRNTMFIKEGSENPTLDQKSHQKTLSQATVVYNAPGSISMQPQHSRITS